MGKAFEKQTKRIKDQEQNQVEALETISGKSYNSPWIRKEIYDNILEERMDEMLEISREIGYYNLVYRFRGPTKAIGLTKFGSPMYTYYQLQRAKKHYNK